MGKNIEKLSHFNRKVFVDDFKIKCNKLYNNEFTYDKVNFTSLLDTIIVSHQYFGDFETNSGQHYRGILPRRMSHILKKINNTDSSKFRFVSGCDYLNMKSELIQFECTTHNIIINSDLKSKPIECILCSKRNQVETMIGNHGDIKNVDYSKFNEYTYVNNKTQSVFICKIHKTEFKQRPDNHFYNHQRCPKCKGGIKLTIEDIQPRTRHKIIEYERGLITMCCEKHGIFKKKLSKIQQDCQKCVQEMNMSLGEKLTTDVLSNLNLKFEHQKRFESCINIKCLPFDFYLTEYNICIEYDGEQHFREDAYGGTKEEYLYRIWNDSIKTQWCLDNNIKLIRIKYTNDTFDKIKSIVEKEFVLMI